MEDRNGALDAKLMLVPLDNRRGAHPTLRTGAAVDEDYVVEPSRPWLVISAPGTAEEGRAKPSLFFLPDVRQLSHRPGARTEARGVFPDTLEVQVPVTLFVGIRLRIQQKGFTVNVSTLPARGVTCTSLASTHSMRLALPITRLTHPQMGRSKDRPFREGDNTLAISGCQAVVTEGAKHGIATVA